MHLLTLNRLGVLLDLALRCARRHVPHDHLPRGVSRSQAQAIGGAKAVVIVLPGPFNLASRRSQSKSTFALDKKQFLQNTNHVHYIYIIKIISKLVFILK